MGMYLKVKFLRNATEGCHWKFGKIANWTHICIKVCVIQKIRCDINDFFKISNFIQMMPILQNEVGENLDNIFRILILACKKIV